MIDPGQASAPQRRHLKTDQWFQSDVAGFRDEHGAYADREITDSRRVLADVGELGGELRTCSNFEEDFWQIHSRQSGVDRFTKLNQTRWFFQLVEAGQDQPVLASYGLDACRWIIWQVGRYCAVGLIPLAAQRGDRLVRRKRVAE